MSTDYDCIVVGAGLAGSALAIALDGLGLSTALLEARADRAPEAQAPADQRGLALAQASRGILAGIGVWEPLAAQVTPIRRIHVSERGGFGCTRIDAQDLGMDALGYVCGAAHLAASLEAALARAHRVHRIRPARPTHIETRADAVELATTHEGRTLRIRGRLLAVADGSRSATRGLLGIDAQTFDYGRSAVVANVSLARPQPYTAFERFTVQGPIALLPAGGARYVSVWTMPQGRVAARLQLDDAAYAAALSARFGDRLGEFSAPGPRQAYPLERVRALELARPRAVLLGNAAHTVHPNAAQGLNLGLRDVACLVEAVAAALRGGGDPGGAAVTAEYARRRAGDAAQVLHFTDALARGFATGLLPVRLLRNAALLAVDLLPGLKRDLARRATGLGGRPPRLACGASLAALRHED